RGPHLHCAGQAARVVLQQADNHLSHIFRRQLPGTFTRYLMLSEARVHAAGHHIADADVVVAQVLHDRFAEPIQSKLGSIVSRPSFERVLPGQAADIDDVSTTTLLKVWNG